MLVTLHQSPFLKGNYEKDEAVFDVSVTHRHIAEDSTKEKGS